MNPAPPASPSRPVQALGRVPVHPVLVAVWPALALWAANVGEVLPRDVWPAVWIPVAATGAAWLLAALGLRSWRRGALVASFGAAVFLNAGRVVGGGAGTATVVISAALVLVTVVVVWRLTRSALVPTTAVCNVLAATLVLLAVPPVLAAWGPGSSRAEVAVDERGGGGLAGRDIWYVIPDRYPRADTLADVFDFDNTPFLSGLEDRGFQVADRALANYPKTAHSLVSTWNLATVEELIPDPPSDGSDWQPLYRLLREHRLGRILIDAGYEYIHLGSWFGPTATASSADRVLRVDTDSEFVTVWQTQTLLPAFRDVGTEEGGTLRDRQRRHSSYQLDQLDRLARQRSDQPRFILAHITLPHEPYVFGPDGEYVTEEQQDARTREENITNQVIYLNSRLQSLVDELLSGPPATWPVIVIQSDEGPHPAARTGPAFDWTTAPDEVIAEKLRTLSAILLPGSDVELPEDLTGIDTWRYVLDATVGTDFGPVSEPPIKVFPGEDHLYDLHDVSDRIE